MEASEDKRRLHRAVEYKHPAPGVYSTADAMHAVTKLGARKWVRGVRQPYHSGEGNTPSDYDYTGAKPQKRLRDAQNDVESEEMTRPRRAALRTQFNDRRGR